MKYDINEENFDILVAKFYNGKYWTVGDLEDDLRRVKYIKRLIGKYVRRGELNERLILNHIIVLANVFGPEFTCKLLFFKLAKEHYPSLKTFLLFLDYLPDTLNSVNGTVINTKDIHIDNTIANVLRKI